MQPLRVRDPAPRRGGFLELCCLAHGSVLDAAIRRARTRVALDHHVAGLDDVDIAVMNMRSASSTTRPRSTTVTCGRSVISVCRRPSHGRRLAATARCLFSKTLDALGVLPDATTRSWIPGCARRSSWAGRSPRPEPSGGGRAASSPRWPTRPRAREAEAISQSDAERRRGPGPCPRPVPRLGGDVAASRRQGSAPTGGQRPSAATACGNWSSRTYTRYPNAPRPSVTPVDA